MIEGIYITDATNALIYEYSLSLNVPKFKSLLPKITESSTTTNNTIITLNSQFYLVSQRECSIIIYLLCQSNQEDHQDNPLDPFIFIRRLLETLHDYFGELKNPNKIEANNDTLTLLLYQMLDDTIPYTTDFNKLKDLVAYKSLLSKLLSSASSTAGRATAALQPQSQSDRHSSPGSSIAAMQGKDLISDIPWRRANVRHTNNEMFVDVIETVNVILKPTPKSPQQGAHFDSAFYSSSNKTSNQENYMISGSIDGEINFISRLSGVPLLQLVFNSLTARQIMLPSFHQCVNRDAWKERHGILSFVPPDGKCTLMKYQIDLYDQFQSNQQRMGVLRQTTLDVDFKCHDNSNEFEIRLLFGNKLSKIDSITVEIVCESFDDQIKINRITHGDYRYKGHGKGEWNLRQLKSGVLPVFHGSVISSRNVDEEKEEEDEGNDSQIKNHSKHAKPSYIRLIYSHKGAVPSGLKVDTLKIVSAKGLGESVKPYKGVKYITKSGDFIIRT
ncbi:uncharacterized protein J8A68_003993 [[Candida] subhashii]|uniref:MHD domain-containing protein n=1 Tax=[Candida] subhashii TaxID=561895 RepID=A0A8J5UL27_9ASCO|nr:uncharacterized protein J8A68_003993 [[Candida] subhashii]KAG7662462.1 hypothetical protein J8A68_003993 [[Candida] subhashii]